MHAGIGRVSAGQHEAFVDRCFRKAGFGIDRLGLALSDLTVALVEEGGAFEPLLSESEGLSGVGPRIARSTWLSFEPLLFICIVSVIMKKNPRAACEGASYRPRDPSRR